MGKKGKKEIGRKERRKDKKRGHASLYEPKPEGAHITSAYIPLART